MFELANVLAQRSDDIDFDPTLPGLIALVAGVVILFVPRVLNYIVAAYLIIVGAIQVFDIKI